LQLDQNAAHVVTIAVGLNKKTLMLLLGLWLVGSCFFGIIYYLYVTYLGSYRYRHSWYPEW